MGGDWRDCVVVLIDLVGIKRLAASSDGSAAMRSLHRTALEMSRAGLAAIDHLYAWNDSLLLLSFIDRGDRRRVGCALRDAEAVRAAVSSIVPSYAIAVRGRAFPRSHIVAEVATNVTIIDASSWALANCFAIEKALGKLRMTWYVDSRIVRDQPMLKRGATAKRDVPMLPSGRRRGVFLFGESLPGTA